MNKFKSLGKVLSKEEQKKINGGDGTIGDIDGGGGACYRVDSDQGYSSCWYTTGDAAALCQRVYGSHCSSTSDGPVNCQANHCVMN